jgi:hypothetical protein
MILLVPLVLLILVVVGFKWLYTRMNLMSRLSTLSVSAGFGLYQIGGLLLPHTQWHEWHYATGALAGLFVFILGSGITAWRGSSF